MHTPYSRIQVPCKRHNVTEGTDAYGRVTFLVPIVAGMLYPAVHTMRETATSGLLAPKEV
jgi:hypothetical protein